LRSAVTALATAQVGLSSPPVPEQHRLGDEAQAPFHPISKSSTSPPERPLEVQTPPKAGARLDMRFLREFLNSWDTIAAEEGSVSRRILFAASY
jgi:hypothetical protein